MLIDLETRIACEAAIGRERVIDDSLAPEVAVRLGILLGRPLTGDHLPPTWHWAYFNLGYPQADQGYDLHERTGIFLPAAPFPRRMWAGGSVTMHRPLRLRQPARQRVRVASVEFKEGRSGAMCFVSVDYTVEQADALCIEERRTIVYRDRGAPAQALRQPGDPVPEGFRCYHDGQLFFYSAVTHNGHRIHWDRDFCRQTEGYPDLVVHGPMLATDLCDAMRGEGPGRFTYRAEAPVFVTSPVRIEPGRILRSDGVTAMAGQWQPLP